MADGGAPTAAQLRDRIDRGETGDKVPLVDPAAAGLGTDDEAAGTPPDAAAVGIATAQELGRRPDPVNAPGLSGGRFAPHGGGQPRRVPRGLIVVGVLTILFICAVVLVEILVR
ncbi:hypothetical protein P7L64_03785 (plasmid) [Tistrella bauzanensis]|nr:hypothetical protein [Tistrella bauzanensis]